MKTIEKNFILRDVSNRKVTEFFKDLMKLRSTAVCISGFNTYKIRGPLSASDMNLLANRYGSFKE